MYWRKFYRNEIPWQFRSLLNESIIENTIENLSCYSEKIVFIFDRNHIFTQLNGDEVITTMKRNKDFDCLSSTD